MIREPAVAGQFYSGNAKTLLQVIKSLVPKPDRVWDGKAIVVPHAGYVYSGAVAGAVYSSVDLPKRFIILGPNHKGIGSPLAAYPAGEWRTPLGLVGIDADLTERLTRACPPLRRDPIAHLREHSLEVQIPFLQALVPDFKFAAICVGTGEYGALEELGHALAEVRQSVQEPVLLVSSSDMNHYESAAVTAAKDRQAIEQMEAVDSTGLFRVVREKDISMCGFAPTVAVLTACRDLGSSHGHLIRYAHSGEVSGDHESVVGYAGMVIL